MRILISKFTKDALDESYLLREIDDVQVRGKNESVKIYEVMIDTERNNQIKVLYEEALSHFYDKNIQKAKELFEKCDTIYDDKTSKVFIEKYL